MRLLDNKIPIGRNEPTNPMRSLLGSYEPIFVLPYAGVGPIATNALPQRPMRHHMHHADLCDALPLSLCHSLGHHHSTAERQVRRCRFTRLDSALLSSLYGTVNAFILCTLIFLALASHARASYTDPGFVPLPKKGIDFSDVKLNDGNANHGKVRPDGEGALHTYLALRFSTRKMVGRVRRNKTGDGVHRRRFASSLQSMRYLSSGSFPSLQVGDTRMNTPHLPSSV
jgi:hypothetical protein